MKRFYREVGIGPAPAGAGPDAGCPDAARARHCVLLDGKLVRTPGRALLALPGVALAEAVAGEWASQQDTINHADMPLTGLAFTAIDRVMPNMPAIVAQTAGYADTDLLCYFADGDAELTARQQACWQPLLDWSGEALGLPLQSTAGIVPITQDAAVLAGFIALLDRQDAWRLTGISHLTGLTGSLVIALALAAGHLGADAAFAASQLDELYQAERWGSDRDADRRRIALQQEIRDSARFLDLLAAG